MCRFLKISIHAPLAGSDIATCYNRKTDCNFNPRSPRGERPRKFGRNPINFLYFNPRSPRGERQRSIKYHVNITGFQSTLPSRGATKCTKEEPGT
ncbi:hypothetical protein GCWU000341_00204 [Oribacterium sp. oral taxon 078 str. F0262]|nr:hypothetical protein GCWU000341_00204 [Oribacterium sp. oral taxon 078 str. F0262]